MQLDLTGLRPLQAGGEALSFDTSGLTPLDTTGLTPFQAQQPDTAQEDGWLDLGRRWFENIGPRARAIGGGLMQAYGEADRTPTIPNLKPEIAAAMYPQAERDAAIAQKGREIREAAMADMQANAPNVAPESAKDYVYQIANAVTDMVPSLTLSFLTRSPTAGAAMMTGQVYGQQYGQARDEGYSPERAQQDALALSAIEGLTEKIPLGVLTKEGGGFMTRTLKSLGAEGIQEGVNEAIQAGYDARKLQEREGGSFADAWEKVGGWNRVKNAGIVGAGAGGSLAVATHPLVREEKPKVEISPEIAATLTQDDIDSPIPNAIILEGRQITKDALDGKPAPSIPAGAVKADVLFGAEPTPAPTPEPEPESRVRPAEAEVSPVEPVQPPLPVEAAPQPPVSGPPPETAAPTPVEGAPTPLLDASGLKPVELKPVEGLNLPANNINALEPETPAKEISPVETAPAALPQLSVEPLPVSAQNPPQPTAAPSIDPNTVDAGTFTDAQLRDANLKLPRGYELRREGTLLALFKDGYSITNVAPDADNVAREIAFRKKDDPKGKMVPPGLLRMREQEAERKAAQRRTSAGSAEAGADAMTFLAARGGIRDDEGHDLLKGRNLQRFTRRGNVIRKSGMTIDAAGEALWDAGYFGPVATTPRPTEREVLEFLERAHKAKTYLPEIQAQRDEARAVSGQQDQETLTRDTVRSLGKDLGLVLSEDEVGVVVDLMTAENMDAETALDTYAERLAIQQEVEIAEETDGDIPFEGIAAEPGPAESELRADAEGSGRTGIGESESEARSSDLGRPRQEESAQGAVDQTDQGAQRVLPGAEKITDRQLVERKMAGKAKATAPQLNTEGLALFDKDARPQPELFDAPAKKEEPVETKVPVLDAPYTLGDHTKNAKRMSAGDITAEEWKAEFERLVRSEASIKAELNTKTLKELAPNGTGGLTKAKIIDRIFASMADRYIIGSYSWTMGENPNDAKRRAVQSVTDEQIKESVKARDDYRAARMKAVQNPETLSEFREYHERGGKYENLSAEKQKLYDRLTAETRQAQDKQERERAAVVRKVDTNVGMTMVETKHTRDNYDLFVVRLSERVDGDTYKDLNGKAKQLGGWYSSYAKDGAVPGFQFKTKDAAEKFMALKEGNVSQADRLEGRAKEAEQSAAERLSAMADTMDAEADESLGAERKTNTARRADMAAGAEAKAQASKAMAATLRKIAGALEKGEAPLLSRIRYRTQVEELERTLQQAKYARNRKENRRSDEWDRAVDDADVAFATYPKPRVFVSQLRSFLERLPDMKGYIRDKREALKAIEGKDPDSFHEFDALRGIELLQSLIGAGKEAGLKWEVSNLQDAWTRFSRMREMGIHDAPSLRAALREYMEYRGTKAAADPIKAAERALVGAKIDGYFPTPKDLAADLVERAGIAPGMSVLEPSAGKGNIADAIAEVIPKNDIATIEPVSSLRALLTMKGYHAEGGSFLDHDQTYDRIVMNPPFENGQDIDHVRHAYTLLKPGGKVVAIMSEGPFYRQDRKATAFRDWLDQVGGVSEKLPDGSFKDSERSTGVSTRVVEIVKSDAAKDAESSVPIDIEPRFDGQPFPQARLKAQEWARSNIKGKYRNDATGWDIEVTTAGIKEATSHTRSYRDLDVVASLPDLLRAAKLERTEPPKTAQQSLRAMHIMTAPFRHKGADYDVTLYVREFKDGRRFYDQFSEPKRKDPGVVSAALQAKPVEQSAPPPGPEVKVGPNYIEGKPEERGFINLFGPRDGTDSKEMFERDVQAAKLFATQPLDRAMRIPFDVFGGVNERGEWQPGRMLFDKAKEAIVHARFDDAGRFGYLNGFLDRARAGLLDRYGLDEAYVARERLRTLDERKILARVPELLETLKSKGVGPEEAKVLQAVLTGEDVGSAEMEKLAEPIRRAIDDLGAEAVQLGLLDAEAFERNRGKYLHRVYLKHEADERGLAKFMSGMAGRRRKKIIGEQFKGRGMWMEVEGDRLIADGRAAQKGDRFLVFDNLSDRGQGQLEGIEAAKPTVVERAYVREDGKIPGKVSGWAERGAWEVRGTKGGKIVLWRDYTKAERQQMGEIMDARYTIAKTYMLMAHDLATGRFYKDVSQNADWTSTDEPAGKWVEAGEYNRFGADPSVKWVKVPASEIAKSNTKRYGALAGKYVRAEIWRDISELESLNRPGTWDTLLRQWKLNKTARNPVVHMNNVMSNVVLMDLADVRANDLVAGVKSLVKRDAYYQEALENGALGSDVVAQELKDRVLTPILEQLKLEAQGGRGTMQAQFGTVGRVADAIEGALKKADDKMIELYRMEDEAYRMALFIRLREQGFSAQLAADEARQQFLDYDIRAPWVNAARRTVLPFISYTYRAVPLLARAIATRPWKLAKYATIAWAANAMGYALMGGDEDEERRSLRDEEQGTTWFGAPRMIRMPWGDESGNPVFLDIRRWVPAGDIFDTNVGSLALPMPAPLQFGGPAMMAAEFALNKQAFTGKEITNEYTDDLWDKTSKVSDWAWKSWAPAAPWVPGSWYWDKIENAIAGARDATGRPYDLASAAASSVGVKLKPQDVEQGFYFHGLEYDRIERELRAEMRTLAKDYDRGLISEKAYNAKTEKLFEKMDRLNDRREATFSGQAAE